MTLSIITVNLNNLEGLKRTYDSVVSQTFTDYEWLVIDGGSTDGSREFIEQHQDNFAYWCSEPDKGIYNAMNKGIVRAKGEYLNFMNSGDCFACDKTLGGVFDKERTEDILYGYVMIGNINGKVFLPETMKEKRYWYDFYMFALPHQGTFIRRKRFEDVGLYDENYKVVSDTKWFIEAILFHKVTYRFIPKKIAVFQDGGISQTPKCKEESALLKDSCFSDFLREDTAFNMYRLSIIQSSKITRLLFNMVMVIAIRIKHIKDKRLLNRLSSHS